MTHTPTPWTVDRFDNSIIGPTSERNPDGLIAAVRYLGNSEEAKAETKGNAAIIVRAVNALDPLVAALTAMLRHEGARQYSGIGTEHDSDELEAAKIAAIAALKLAKGE